MDRNTICPPEHGHGQTSTCYQEHRCSCTPCRAAHAARTSARRRQDAYTQHEDRTVPAIQVMAHMADLLQAGLTLQAIALAADLSDSTIRNICTPLAGTRDRIRATTASQILAVGPDLTTLPPDAKVSPRGMQRRIQALAVAGWSLATLAGLLDIPHWQLLRLIEGESAITAELHNTARRLFTQLWDKRPAVRTTLEQGIVTRTIAYAVDRGWVPALAWDDIDLDDAPAIVPAGAVIDELAIELALKGRQVTLTPAERRIAATIAGEYGLSTKEASEVLNISARTVTRSRSRKRTLTTQHEKAAA